MTIEEYWAALWQLGIHDRQQISPEFDYLAKTREGKIIQVADPARLEPDDRAAVVEFMRLRLGDVH